MSDEEIVELYWSRSPTAIDQTAQQYGAYCHTIAYQILGCREDAEERVSDTWLAAWNTIPPHRPQILRTFLGKITRQLSLKHWRDCTRLKRGGGEVPLALEELGQCVAGGNDPESAVLGRELGQYLQIFVAGLPETERNVFLCRYWYLDPVAKISRDFGFSLSKTKSMLYRTRQQLQRYLAQEGLL